MKLIGEHEVTEDKRDYYLSMFGVKRISKDREYFHVGSKSEPVKTLSKVNGILFYREYRIA